MEFAEEYNNDGSSSSQMSENEMFIIGGLVSQSNEDKALIERLKNCKTLYIIVPSISFGLSNLSCLTGVEEDKLSRKILALRRETIYKGQFFQKQVMDEFGVYVTLIPKESDALFLLDLFDSNHHYLPIFKSILNLSRQFCRI